jgi:hypothetical protein
MLGSFVALSSAAPGIFHWNNVSDSIALDVIHTDLLEVIYDF